MTRRETFVHPFLSKISIAPFSGYLHHTFFSGSAKYSGASHSSYKSSKETRRVDLTFSVAYEEDVTKVKNVLVNILKKNPLVLEDPAFFVGISMHGDSAINFAVKAWCKTEDYWTVYYDLLETVKVRFDEEGISIPYPQMDLHVKKNIIID